MTPEDEAAARLARFALVEVAPEELPLFRATSQAYFSDPEGTLTKRKGRDEMLGFGVEAAVILVTPVALDVAKTVLEFITTRVRQAFEKEGGAAIDGAVAGLFRRLGGGGSAEEPTVAAAEPAAVKLDAAELEEVRRVALERAKALDLPDDKAALLADAVVGGLA